MKRIIIIAAMALMSMTAFAQEPVDTTSTIKLACVDYREIVLLMPEMDEVRAVLNENRQTQQEVFMEMVQEYQTKRQQYEQNSATWTQSVLDVKARELMDIETRLQETQQNFQAELEQLEQQQTAGVVEKANKVIRELASELGVAVVFDKAELLYIDPTQIIDITGEARAVLGIPEERTLETLQAELNAQAQAMQQAMGGM
jgi:outer membrane protein